MYIKFLSYVVLVLYILCTLSSYRSVVLVLYILCTLSSYRMLY